jgi:hypothetical protein
MADGDAFCLLTPVIAPVLISLYTFRQPAQPGRVGVIFFGETARPLGNYPICYFTRLGV